MVEGLIAEDKIFHKNINLTLNSLIHKAHSSMKHSIKIHIKNNRRCSTLMIMV